MRQYESEIIFVIYRFFFQTDSNRQFRGMTKNGKIVKIKNVQLLHDYLKWATTMPIIFLEKFTKRKITKKTLNLPLMKYYTIFQNFAHCVGAPLATTTKKALRYNRKRRVWTEVLGSIEPGTFLWKLLPTFDEMASNKRKVAVSVLKMDEVTIWMRPQNHPSVMVTLPNKRHHHISQ